jgi:hypothetical protein
MPPLRAKVAEETFAARTIKERPFAYAGPLTGSIIDRCITDAGYRGHCPSRSKFKVYTRRQKRRLTQQIKREFTRRAAIEPLIAAFLFNNVFSVEAIACCRFAFSDFTLNRWLLQTFIAGDSYSGPSQQRHVPDQIWTDNIFETQRYFSRTSSKLHSNRLE